MSQRRVRYVMSQYLYLEARILNSHLLAHLIEGGFSSNLHVHFRTSHSLARLSS